jgi:GR25 family glycosyltransferase involved in LPS biosynthesis
MKTYVINLDKRADRWIVVREHLAELGFKVTRFTAIEGGWRGCRDSHLGVMELCKDEDRFLIFEDDVLFLEDVNYINTAMMQLPPFWDCLFLGASPQEPQERYLDNLFRISNSKCTHATIWHNRENGAIEYILSHKEDILKIDDYLSEIIFPNFNCFLIYPLLVTQRQTQSDTCGRSDISTIVKNYNKFCK